MTKRGWLRWAAAAAETLIFLAGVSFLITTAPWALITWLGATVLYLIGGAIAVWKGGPLEGGGEAELRLVAPWSWIPPVLAASVGAASAITALVANRNGSSGGGDVVLIVAAALGVILSWVLLQVGFAQMYLILDTTGEGEDLRFPEGSVRSVLGFLYFSFTLGTSFATSDVEVISVRMQRLVLLHTVVAFFYNALVVAVAFQILQGVLRG